MEVVFYIGIALFVLFGPWILLWRGNFRRKSDRLEDQTRWAEITSRIYTLERELKELRSQGIGQSPQVPQLEVTAPAPSEAVATTVSSATPSQAAAEARVTGKAAEVSRVAPAAAAPEVPTPPSSLSAPPSSPPPSPPASTRTPVFAAAESGPSLFDRFKSSVDIEEMLGTDWLNKLGIILLVLGVAFFLAYQLKTLGPAGKVLVGLVTSAVLLGAGI